jgi:hypothetical protein
MASFESINLPQRNMLGSAVIFRAHFERPELKNIIIQKPFLKKQEFILEKTPETKIPKIRLALAPALLGLDHQTVIFLCKKIQYVDRVRLLSNFYGLRNLFDLDI